MINSELNLLQQCLPEQSRIYIMDADFALFEGCSVYTHSPSLMPLKLQQSMVIICMKGRMTFTLNMHEFSLQEHDLVLAAEGSILQQISVGPGTEVMACIFHGDYYVEEKVENVLIGQRLFLHPIMHIEADDAKEVQTLFKLMEQKIAQTNNPYRRKAIDGYLQVLISNGYQYLLQQMNIEKDGKSAQHQQLFYRFILLVQQHCRTQHAITFYADKLCLTPKYLSQIILRVSGKLAGRWINEYLLLEAKNLLAYSQLSVMQIADELNYSSPSAFISFFKKEVGCTPRAFQEKLMSAP